MKILLVIPDYNGWYSFPLGMPYISSYLKSKKIDVYTLNLNHTEKKYEEVLREHIIKNNIDIVAVSVSVLNYMHCKYLTTLARSIKENITIIIGGGCVSGDPETVMISMKDVDIAVIGEGEITLSEIVESLIRNEPYDNIRGILYRDKNNLIYTKKREDILFLDDLPMPDYDGFSFREYLETSSNIGAGASRALPILTSRACPYQCTYCFHTCGSKYRQINLDKIFNELDILVNKYDISFINFYDELISHDFNRLKEICNRVKKYNIDWGCSIRVELVTEELLKMLKDANCVSATFGIESCSQKVLDSMNKNITVNQINKALKLEYKYNFFIDGNLIFGDRAETLETVNESLNWHKKNKRYCINIGSILTLPGSEIYNFSCRKKIIDNRVEYLESENYIVKLPEVSDEEYKKMLDLVEMSKMCFSYEPYGIKIFDSNRENVNVVGKCRKCKQIFANENVNKFEQVKLTCGYCGQRYIILPYKYMIKYKKRSKIEYDIAFWSCNAINQFLINESKIFDQKKCCIIGNEDRKSFCNIKYVNVKKITDNYKTIIFSTKNELELFKEEYTTVGVTCKTIDELLP